MNNAMFRTKRIILIEKMLHAKTFQNKLLRLANRKPKCWLSIPKWLWTARFCLNLFLVMLNFSTSEENYLKTIFHLQTKDDNVSTNELAEKLQAKPASITDMMKKLKTRKLVNYQPYQGFRLTPEGKKVAAMNVARKP